MDGEYLWVILLVIYLIFQVLGGKKKKKTTKRPDPTRRPSPDASGERRPETLRQTRSRDAELDDALLEIRRALGFPDAAEQPHEPAPEVEAQRESPPVAKREPEEPHPVTVDSGRPKQMPTTPTPPRERPFSIPKPTVPQGGIGGSITASSMDRERTSDRLRKPSPALKPDKKIHAVQAVRTEPSRSKQIRKRLHSGPSLREAFLLKEVLDHPRSKRPLR